MTAYWITFDDGSSGCCEGEGPYDAIIIAQKISGKKVVLPDGKHLYSDGVAEEIAKPLPYPASPIIWQFNHPVSGLTPPFCHSPKKCVDQGRCPQERSCCD